MLDRFDFINIIRDVNYDDAFYYFQIAYHLSEGKFSTFDGGITQTNGYHPLWMLMITPFYWVFDKETALFGIKAFEIILVAGGVALVAVAAWLARLPWILLFATLPLLCQHSGLFRGMEAAAALFMLGLFFLAILLYAREPARRKWLLTAIAFALPWVRLEYVAISLSSTAALYLIEWSWRDKPFGASLKEFARSIYEIKAVAPLLGAVAGILVYFAYNWLTFGGVAPVSGATKQAWSRLKFENEGGYNLVQNFRDIIQIHVFDLELLVALATCGYLLVVWWFTHRSKSKEDWLLLAFLVGMFGLAVGHLAKFAQTVLTMYPRWAGHSWHFVPAYLMMALIVPVSCYVAIHFIRRFMGPRSQYAANILSVSVVVVGAAFLITQTDFTSRFRHIDRSSTSESTDSWGLSSYAGMLVMNRALPNGSIIGSWDSGFTGYFSDFPVVNLDGLVNDYDYFHEYGGLYGGGVYRLKDYAQTLHSKFGITYYTNIWDIPVKNSAGATLYEGPIRNRYDGDRYRAFQLWPAEPTEAAADPNAWFWERIEPHFDYHSDGVGMIVDGRIAQALKLDCAPDELIVWSYMPEDATVIRHWTQTQTGLCVAALMLPRDALPPVRVETIAVGEYLAAVVGDRQPSIRSDFDVHLIENRLIYVRDGCELEDVEPAVFLHLDPVDADDLPEARKQHGYDNLDFHFEKRGIVSGGICLVEVALPEYDIVAIRTGQYVPVGGGFERLWEGEIHLEE